MFKKLKLPIGIENFEKLRKQNFYYVDKTLLIKDLLENWGEVNLFTRPRRFGKSLNMDMMQNFFEIGRDSSLFDGLNISKENELCKEYMGKFPVISVSLKGVSGINFKDAKAMMSSVISLECDRHKYLLNSNKIDEYDKIRFDELLRKNENNDILVNSILVLSNLLFKHYNKQVIILIDEYDVPLDKAYKHGYYDEMVSLIYSIFMQALKTNDSLYFAVLTGCLRVSKESIFTGLNNPKVFSITDAQFDEYFGFTNDEVVKILQYYNLSEHYETTKLWYDGYRFGNVDVFCPWDVINHCYELCYNKESQPKAYWANTSGNEIIRKFISKATDATTKRDIENLIAGEIIQKEIKQDLTYKDLDQNIENLWSVLFTTGYLTQREVSNNDVLNLAIPNLEIRKNFKNQIYEWFNDTIRKEPSRLDSFCRAFIKGDTEFIEANFQAYLRQTISIRDTYVKKDKKENFYYGILLCMLSHMEEWVILSNAESGDGYSDILVEVDEESIGIVIEVKYGESENLELACKNAFKQIEEKRYAEKLIENGMKTILKYAVACYKKRCMVIFEKN